MTNELRQLVIESAQQRGYRVEVTEHEGTPAAQVEEDKATEILFGAAFLAGNYFHDQRLIVELADLIHIKQTTQSEGFVILY